MSDAPKPTSTIDLTLTAIDLFKSAALVFVMVIIEWARAKQKFAENKAAVADVNLAVAKAQGEIDAEAARKDPVTIVDEFLHGSPSPSPVAGTDATPTVHPNG